MLVWPYRKESGARLSVKSLSVRVFTDRVLLANISDDR
jgi:hypothetical protein